MTTQDQLPGADTDIDDDDFDYEVPPENAPPQQVPAYIAIIRIIAVLGMGLCISFGLFIMLAGLRGVVIGIPILLLAIPCYYGMQLAEKLVARQAGLPPPDET